MEGMTRLAIVQYCTYSLADTNDRAILQMNVVDVREAAGKSNNMERIGFERGMDTLLASPIVMKEVVTDGHIEIAALMKREEKYKEVTHQNDVWHGAKNIAKKITTAAKSKDNADLTLWAPSIRNHFWYCSKTCANDSKNLKDKWIGILHHVVDEHAWVLEEGVNGGKCEHDPLNESERKKPWLKKESSAHKALAKIILDTRFLNTLVYYVNFRLTGFLESFHNVILMYAPKRHAYSYSVYQARNRLAALDFNHHRGRAPATTADGKERYGRKFSKRTQQWCRVRVLVPKEFSYIPELMQKVFIKRITSEGNVNKRLGIPSDDPRQIAPNIAPVPPPSVQTLVDTHKTRF
ncbi:uncharacterized protein LOC114517456 [Dendronephthya gigantea]|uniref:uncharacterized protein LOC114517456 n=2 Tax=Dendronephthya gigantea TaxID=151771 RepID=UPI00106BE2FB|nr:uncharacterized protein LOC114517456 [Dendronephthya gigantea]XP_028392996.1 uncharacterized protein LOC114517456 [Dendronephthya gigantea]